MQDQRSGRAVSVWERTVGVVRPLGHPDCMGSDPVMDDLIARAFEARHIRSRGARKQATRDVALDMEWLAMFRDTAAYQAATN